MKNVVIISSSPRLQSNSVALCESFRKGAEEAGHHVESVALRNVGLSYCKGCSACTGLHRCVQKDGGNDLCEKVAAADVLVLATPIYFNNMTGHMKVFFDRLYPVVSDIHAEVYLFCTAYDPDDAHMNQVLDSIRWFTRDQMGLEEKGTITAGEIDDKQIISDRPEMAKAYEMGLNC